LVEVCPIVEYTIDLQTSGQSLGLPFTLQVGKELWVSSNITNSSIYEYSVSNTIIAASTEKGISESFSVNINVGCY